MPIKSSSEVISKYVGKYISKHISQRLPEDKGVRLVEYSRGARDGTTYFSWVCATSWLWREKVRAWAASMGLKNEEEVRSTFGKHWAFHCRQRIMRFPLDRWPSMVHVMADETGPDPAASFIEEDAINITRYVDGRRQWQLESRCNPGFDEVTLPKMPTEGRPYVLTGLPHLSDDKFLKKLLKKFPYFAVSQTQEQRVEYSDRVNPTLREARRHGIWDDLG